MLGTLVSAVLIVIIAILVRLCAAGKIQRNPLVGIRIPAFFASDEAWQVGHRSAILPLVTAAVLGLAVVAFVVVFPTLGDIAGTLINCGLLLAGVVWGAVRGTRALRRQS